MVDADTLLQAGREAIAIRASETKRRAPARGMIVKLADAPARTNSTDLQ